jgi:cytoskeletal protein CcmA (bactofilin family)
MFRKRNEQPKRPSAPRPPSRGDASPSEQRITSVLGNGVVWNGQLAGSGGVRIEGIFEGEITLRGVLVVGETGRITCNNLRAHLVVVAGVVNGDITAEKIEIRRTGKVMGNVSAVSFATEEGAFLRGQIRMEEQIDIGIGLPPSETQPLSESQATEEAQPSTNSEG